MKVGLSLALIIVVCTQQLGQLTWRMRDISERVNALSEKVELEMKQV